MSITLPNGTAALGRRWVLGMGAVGGNTPTVLALAVSGGTLYAGGRVHFSRREAAWVTLHRAMGRR